MNAIEIRGLKKSFRGLYALDGLDMTIPVGAIYGFIGENGSGKSTTEKLICGHLIPDRYTFHDSIPIRISEGQCCIDFNRIYENLYE